MRKICIDHETPLNPDGTCRYCHDANGKQFILDMQSYYLGADPAASVSPPQFPEIVIRKRLDDLWATADTFATLSDKEITELILEDVTEFLDGAKWEVNRGA